MRLLLILSLLFIFQSVHALDTVTVKSKITAVTVFFNGAQVEREANIRAGKGKHLFLLDNLPGEINPMSIQVAAVPGAQILSVKHQLINPSETEKSKEEIALEDKIKSKRIQINQIRNKIAVFQLEEKVLMSNSDLNGKDQGTSIAQIKEAADFYRLRLNDIRQGKLNLNLELEQANEDILDLYRQFNEINSSKRLPYSTIEIALDCQKEIISPIIVNYNVKSAGWSPLYDFRVDDITKPFTIVYHANVFQTTGEDWNNVKLTLSTSNPSLSGFKPELQTWYIGNTYRKVNKSNQQPGALKGRVIDPDNKEAIPFANVVLRKNSEQVGVATTDIDGQFIIKPLEAGFYDLKISFVGYNPSEYKGIYVEGGNTTIRDFMIGPPGTELKVVEMIEYDLPLIDNMPGRSPESVDVTVGGVFSGDGERGSVRGSRSAGTEVYIDGVKVKDTKNLVDYSVNSKVTHTEYMIKIPYSIPSDGEDYSIRIKEETMPVEYTFITVPKLDNDVFLTAGIPDWTELNLLPGKANIYYQGTFTGESEVGSGEISDTLVVSLGRDNNILVERTGNKELSNRSIIGGNVKQSVAWDITVKNNKNLPIKIVVEDQFPVSELKAVEVERGDSSGAKVEEKESRLTWELQLAPGEKRVLRNYYSVKYPKEMHLQID